MSDIDRLPPHSIEAEEAVLGSVLIDPDALDRLPCLAADDFYIIRSRRAAAGRTTVKTATNNAR